MMPRRSRSPEGGDAPRREAALPSKGYRAPHAQQDRGALQAGISACSAGSKPISRASRVNQAKQRSSAMTIRTRKFLGAIALILLAAVWSLFGMAMAQMPVIANSGWLQAVYYVVVGIGLFHQDGEVEPGRPAADADDPHLTIVAGWPLHFRGTSGYSADASRRRRSPTSP